MGLTRPRAEQIFNLDYKQATRVVTVANITLAGGAPAQVDNVNLVANDRVLVTGQSTANQNGLYYVVTVGTGSNGTWARTSDGNENGEIEAGMIVMVTEGTIYQDTQWKLITDNPIVIGTTSLVFTQNYSANSISGGTSNVVVYSNANVTISSAGTPNVLIISSTGTVTSGTASVTGNTTAGNLLTSGLVSATGNITGNYFLGNVFYANGITASKIYSGTSEVNVVSSGGNVNVSVGGTSNVAVFATTGLYVTGLESVTGNVTAGNVNTAGNVTGNYLLANIYYATGFSASRIFNGTTEANIGTSSGNANISVGGISNVAVFASTGEYVTGLLSVTGNTVVGNLLTGELISATGNITGNYFLGNGAGLTGINSFSNITVTGGNAVLADSISDTLTLTAGSGISIVADPNTDTITIAAAGAGDSIFATGGDMGTVTETVTASEDLGLVTDVPPSTFYDLGSVIDATGLIYPSQLVLPTFIPGTLPSANPAAQFVYLSTSSIGAMTAFSDGTNWRFTSSGNVVS
jgi:hypothetical protein